MVADECPSVFDYSRKERPINGIGGSNDCPPANQSIVNDFREMSPYFLDFMDVLRGSAAS